MLNEYTCRLYITKKLYRKYKKVLMKNIKELCIEFYQDENIRKNIKEFISPIYQMIYNDIYLYVWVVCFYSMLIIFILLCILFIAIKILNICTIINNNRT
jgi:hypothetical protein